MSSSDLCLSDFCDVDVINEEEVLDLNRFAFVDESAWKELVGSHFSQATIRKVKFVEALFKDWQNCRSLVRVSHLF